MLLSRCTPDQTQPSNLGQNPASDLCSERDECLKKVQPTLNQSNQPLSPPANTFEFPSLLECLSDHQENFRMPLQDFSLLDDSDSDVQHLIKDETHLLSPVLTQVSKEARTSQRSRIRMHEIDETEFEGILWRDRSSVIDSYSLDDLIAEAKLSFGDNKPDFCITTPDHKTRQVKVIDGGTIATIHFHTWSDGFGYWSLIDDAGDEYIVKCFGSSYHIWEGLRRKFSKEPVAKVLKATQQLSRVKLKRVDDHLTSAPSSGLRGRTARQYMPYTMYNAQKKYDAQGVRLTEAELEDVVGGRSEYSPSKGKVSKKRKQSDTSTLDSSTERSGSALLRPPSFLETPMSTEELLANTTLRTRFSGFDRATIPLLAQNCPSNEEFFATIQSKWAFKLNGQNPRYCVAAFPWLGQDKNILLQQSDTEGFNSVIEEIKGAPGWREVGKVEVVIEIFAE